MLRVLVEKAVNLKNVELIGKSDPYCRLEFKGEKKKTKHINDNLNPEWNENIEFDLKGEALTPNDTLEVKVFDHDDVSVDKFMGKVSVPLSSLSGGEKEKKESLTLNDKNNQPTQQSIQLTISYEPPAQGGATGSGGAAGESIGGGGGGGVGSGEGSAAQGGTVGEKKGDVSDLLPAIDKSYSTKVQDFQIRIRIHGARQLPGGNISPLCKVLCWNQTQITAVRHSTNTPFWGKTFFFNFHKSPAELFQHSIVFGVHNSRKLRSDAFIGSFELSIAAVYESPNHAIMHKWLLLGEPEDPQAGSKGYLKVALVVLGPGDEAPDLKAKEDSDDEDIEANILRPAGLQLRPALMKFLLYTGEDYPRMDSNAFSGVKKLFKGGKDDKDFVDPFALVKFAGKEVKSSTKEGTDHPEWYEELKLGVQFPSMCDKLAITVYDWDRLSKNDAIATAFIKIADISALRDGDDGFLPTFGPSFINLYGSPREFSDGLDKFDALNLAKGEGCAYRGRVLCEVQTELLDEMQQSGVNPIPEDMKVHVTKYMRRRKYVLHAAFFHANMISIDDAPIEFEVSIGNYGNNLDETVPPCASTTPPTNAVFDGCYYNFLPWSDTKPCTAVECQWEDISYRLYAVNMITRIADNLEYGLENIEVSMKVDLAEEDLASTVIATLDQFIMDCQTPLPEWTEGCTPVNNLDQKLMKLRHDDLEQLKTQAVKLREEATSAEDVVKELKVYLETLRKIFVEPQNSMPDVVIWMIASEKRIAYFRIPAYDLLFSENQMYRGRYCGEVRTIMLKPPSLDKDDMSDKWKVPAQVRLSLWLGLEKEQTDWAGREDDGLLTVVAETYENEAQIVGKWSSRRPPLTRPNFTDCTGHLETPKENFIPPVGWKWEGDWYISPEFSLMFKKDTGATSFLEDVFYNEKRTPISGWEKAPLAYTDAQGYEKSGPDEIELPSGWVWEDDAWKVDFNRPCDEEGWEYSVDHSIGSYVAVEKVFHMSRRRRLIRRRKVQDITKNVKEDIVAKMMEKKMDARLSLLESMTPAAGEGWEYAFSFSKRFHTPKKGTDNVRRRRWHRKLVSDSPNSIVPGLFQLPPQSDEKKKKQTNMTSPRLYIKYEAKQTWQLNAYIFQARGLLAADQSGLSDPYARVCFINQSQKTERLEKTLSPQWDQTLIFENVVIYGSSNVIVDSPPRVTIELFDWDQIGTDSFLGCCSLTPEVVTDPAEFKKVMLQWYPIKKQGRDGGELLAAFELMLLNGTAPPSPPNLKPGTEIYEVPEGIRPELQRMGIEVLCWGVRNMSKYQLAAVNSPSVEIEVGGTVLSSDVITNLKRTPNFKKSLMFHVAKLPKETLYMPPINIGVRDNRPFGRKPLVGTHVISDISGFKVPPLMQPFDPLEAIPELERAGSPPLIHEQDMDKPYEPEKKALCVRDMDMEQLDPNIDWYSKYYASKGEFKKCTDYKERGYDLLKYLPHPVEDSEGFYHFEDFCPTFHLYRGKSKDSEEDDEENFAGDFKGTFRIYCLPEDPNAAMPLKYLENEVPDSAPVECIVRVYVIKAIDLQPSDPSGLADPYVEIRLGKQKISSKDNYIPNNLNPEFGRMFQLKAFIPIEKDLIIKIVDYDLMTRDDVIGETVIDLENRLLTRFRATCGIPQTYNLTGLNQWRDNQLPSEILATFCKKNSLPEPNYSIEGNGIVTCHIGEHFFNINAFEKGMIPSPHWGPPKERLALHILNALPLVKEHVETRVLQNPIQPGMDQGKLELWVDIFPLNLGQPGPCFDITPRRPKEYELRVIVWNTYDVKLDETSITGERMSDIYVKGWLMGVDEREHTDVHYRSLDGEGNFNWRLIFPFGFIPAENELVVSKKEHFWSLDKTEKRFPAVLCMQVWDNDLFSPDDYLGTMELPLTHMPQPVKKLKECTLDIMNTSSPKNKMINLFESKRASGFWPFADQPGPDGQLTGKLEAEIELLTKEEALERPAGKGQDEPNANPHLDKPKRPETSFFWFTSPFKTCKFIICKRFKCILITIICVFLAVLLIALFIYAIPQLLARKMVGV
ncbi:myoferlin [Echinococcus multilocularis]|uniref:Myoferlin n=1 Tax=Echinococcus multilocularis TaxID=6211 RepID=A0A068YBK7_ECHMU|nr:myoferlin [Echinococcus multilocularis]